MTHTLSILRPLVVIAAFAMPALVDAQTDSIPTAACSVAKRSSSLPRDSIPDLAGIWDFRIDVGNAISTGMMALGHLDDAYAGALTPDATNTVAIRRLTLKGDSVHMAVASRERDVLFAGRLTGADDTLCGIVTYHRGVRYPMIATLRRRARPG